MDDEQKADTRCTCSYSEGGRLLGESCDPSNTYHDTTYEYDARGRLVSVRSLIDTPWEQTEKRLYDRPGNLLSIESYDADGRMVVLETYEYDCWGGAQVDRGGESGIHNLPVVVGRMEFDYIYYGPCPRHYSRLEPQLPW